jgi:hypothetical protein
MDKQTFVSLYLLGVFLVLFLMEFFQWLKEETDETARGGANDCSEKDRRL